MDPFLRRRVGRTAFEVTTLGFGGASHLVVGRPITGAQDPGKAAAEEEVLDRGRTVTEVERETEHGRQEWKVEINAADGKSYDVRVDAKSGNVTRADQDDNDHDDNDDD